MCSPNLLRLFMCLAVGLASLVHAGEVSRFDRNTWQHVLGSAPRPLAVVFTTTDCEYCPAVIERLARDLRRSPVRAWLNVVVMDGAGDGPTLSSDPHFGMADQLFVFDPEKAVQTRYAIDPAWRGVTPYVVLLGKNGASRKFLGMPPAEAVKGFLSGR